MHHIWKPISGEIQDVIIEQHMHNDRAWQGISSNVVFYQVYMMGLENLYWIGM